MEKNKEILIRVDFDGEWHSVAYMDGTLVEFHNQTPKYHYNWHFDEADGGLVLTRKESNATYRGAYIHLRIREGIAKALAERILLE